MPTRTYEGHIADPLVPELDWGTMPHPTEENFLAVELAYGINPVPEEVGAFLGHPRPWLIKPIRDAVDEWCRHYWQWRLRNDSPDAPERWSWI